MVCKWGCRCIFGCQCLSGVVLMMTCCRFAGLDSVTDLMIVEGLLSYYLFVAAAL